MIHTKEERPVPAVYLYVRQKTEIFGDRAYPVAVSVYFLKAVV